MYENVGNLYRIELALKETFSLLRKVKSKSYSVCALLWSVFAVQSAK